MNIFQTALYRIISHERFTLSRWRGNEVFSTKDYFVIYNTVYIYTQPSMHVYTQPCIYNTNIDLRVFVLFFSKSCQSKQTLDCNYHSQIIWHQMEFHLVPNRSKNGKYNQIPVDLTRGSEKIPSRVEFLRLPVLDCFVIHWPRELPQTDHTRRSDALLGTFLWVFWTFQWTFL